MLQIEELLKEARMKKKQEKNLTQTVENLKDILLNMSAGKEHKVYIACMGIVRESAISWDLAVTFPRLVPRGKKSIQKQVSAMYSQMACTCYEKDCIDLNTVRFASNISFNLNLISSITILSAIHFAKMAWKTSGNESGPTSRNYIYRRCAPPPCHCVIAFWLSDECVTINPSKYLNAHLLYNHQWQHTDLWNNTN